MSNSKFITKDLPRTYSTEIIANNSSEDDIDYVQDWCELFQVTESELYDMTENDISSRVDEILVSESEEELKEKEIHPKSDLDYRIPDERDLYKMTKDGINAKLDEVLVLKGFNTRNIDVSILKQRQTYPRQKGGSGNTEDPDSSVMFHILCAAASELEEQFGQDRFKCDGINPCNATPTVTEFNIQGEKKCGERFNAYVSFDYDKQKAYFQSSLIKNDDMIQTTRELPISVSSPTPCPKEGGTCTNNSYESSPAGIKRATTVSHDGMSYENIENMTNPNLDILDDVYDQNEDDYIGVDTETVEQYPYVYKRGVFENPDFQEDEYEDEESTCEPLTANTRIAMQMNRGNRLGVPSNLNPTTKSTARSLFGKAKNFFGGKSCG